MAPITAKGVLSGPDDPVISLKENVIILVDTVKRDDGPDPSKGVLDPHDINNVGFFFLFALIGVAFVLTGIWFFFWAKNGGFHFKEDDWDDYKSTVLRRKGPNGTILSNVTKSTKLGGGSIFKEYDEDGSQTVITESTGLSGITAGPSDIYARERREEKRRKREAERKKRRGGDKKSKNKQGDEGILDEAAEKEAREQLRNYRHERAARVGGLNKETEASDWEGSTNPAESTVSSGLLASHKQDEAAAEASAAAAAASPPPKSKPPRSSGIRKVYSVADRNTARENEKMRTEARKLREEARIAKRDFGYQRAIAATSESQLNESLLSGNSHGDSSLGSSTLSEGSGTKSYHHPMPGLKEYRRREREERMARRGGYLRGNTRDEDLEEEVD